MSFSSGELRKSEFLSLSPRAQVPLITDGDFALTESLAILQYLESRYPFHVLFGENPEDTGKIWQSIQSTTGYIEASVFNFAKPIFASKLEELGGPGDHRTKESGRRAFPCRARTICNRLFVR